MEKKPAHNSVGNSLVKQMAGEPFTTKGMGYGYSVTAVGVWARIND